jgi:hypothetical protein
MDSLKLQFINLCFVRQAVRYGSKFSAISGVAADVSGLGASYKMRREYDRF